VKLLAAIMEDRVRSLASSHFAQVAPDASIESATRQMRDRRTGCALVARAGRLVGIFTERDVLTRVLAKGTPLAEPITTVMTPDPVTLGPEDSVAEVIREMHAGGYRHLPVVDGQGGILGVVSVKAVVCYVVEHFPREIYNLPPDPAQIQSAREGA